MLCYLSRFRDPVPGYVSRLHNPVPGYANSQKTCVIDRFLDYTRNRVTGYADPWTKQRIGAVFYKYYSYFNFIV